METARLGKPSGHSLELRDFLNLKVPPRNLILSPWLPEYGLAMIAAPRGVGKTYFALAIALTVAAGGEFLRFKSEKKKRVIYIDAEMTIPELQTRLQRIESGMRHKVSEGFLKICSTYTTEFGFPDLATKDGQDFFDSEIGDSELIILDNLSSLVKSGRENEAEYWMPIQEWLLTHKRHGRSVLMLHHAGRNGMARGTSKREDVLDTLISLRQPKDYSPSDGARFEIHFDKHRGFFGDDCKSLEVSYRETDIIGNWQYKSSSHELSQAVSTLSQSGMSLKQIANNLNISKSQAHRILQKSSA